ncbi:hypothetical protein BDV97DRAFT_345899 [Delphinella strobiligena]|nr:hypothetical protein BDV97DRAFT_345899 [Delphinella strobiligena]
MAPSTAKQPSSKTTRAIILRLRHTAAPPSISKPWQQTPKRAQSSTKAIHVEKPSSIDDASKTTTTRVSNSDKKAGAATMGSEAETAASEEIKLKKAPRKSSKPPKPSQAAPFPTKPPPKQIKTKNPKPTPITKLSTTTTTPPRNPITSSKPMRTRLRSTPPRTSNQGSIIKTSRPAANDVFLNGKRLNLVHVDGFLQMRDFWEDFGGVVDFWGEFL